MFLWTFPAGGSELLPSCHVNSPLKLQVAVWPGISLLKTDFRQLYARRRKQHEQRGSFNRFTSRSLVQGLLGYSYSKRPNRPTSLRVWHDRRVMPVTSQLRLSRFSYQPIQFSNRSTAKTVALTNWQDATLLPVRPFQL